VAMLHQVVQGNNLAFLMHNKAGKKYFLSLVVHDMPGKNDFLSFVVHNMPGKNDFLSLVVHDMPGKNDFLSLVVHDMPGKNDFLSFVVHDNLQITVFNLMMRHAGTILPGEESGLPDHLTMPPYTSGLLLNVHKRIGCAFPDVRYWYF
jgi:hypothetical protein